MNNIKKNILHVMATVFNMDVVNIHDDAAPGLVEAWDSLRHMTLIVSLEEEFGIRFTDDEMTDLLNLKLIQQIISSKFPNHDI
jgi:acyl carrier protein